jgi:hypothetical protein
MRPVNATAHEGPDSAESADIRSVRAKFGRNRARRRLGMPLHGCTRCHPCQGGPQRFEPFGEGAAKRRSQFVAPNGLAVERRPPFDTARSPSVISVMRMVAWKPAIGSVGGPQNS